MLTVYHYPNCSTCKKALAWLRANEIAFAPIDIVAQPPAAKLLAGLGVPRAKLFNVAGASYRDGDFKTKLPAMTDAQAYAALAADGKLVKRPLAVGDGVALVGFDEAAWARALR
ncbi:MAG TPA: Spx/MgsR family RNA polymerase-binding regulatory protein [Kofleriaceae bacterium]